MPSSQRRSILKRAASAIALSLTGSFPYSAQASVPLRISTSWSNDPKYSTGRIWYDRFLVHLTQTAGKGFGPQFFPDSQLGQEADVMGQMKLGVVDIMINGSSIWSNIVPEFGVFDLGYVTDDYAHLKRIVATPEVAALSERLLQKGGVHIPSWLRPAGARNILVKKNFENPMGLAGMKIRTIPNKTVTDTLRLMGAAATPLAFGEIYTALQAGVLDGVEHDAPTVVTSKFAETAKFYVLTGHIIQPIIITLSARSIQRYPAALRDNLITAIQRTTDEVNDAFATIESQSIADLKSQKIAVNSCDRNAFRARVKPLWEEFAKQTPAAQPTLDAINRTRAS